MVEWAAFKKTIQAKEKKKTGENRLKRMSLGGWSLGTDCFGSVMGREGRER